MFSLLFSANIANSSDILHEVAVPLVSNEKCEEIHQQSIPHSQLCAGGIEASVSWIT